MITQQYVIDASVAAKWVLPIEPYQENALKLRDDHISETAHLSAPTVLTVELTNVLWKAVKQQRLTQGDAQEALQALGDVKISLYEPDWIDATHILKIACKLDLAVYDSTYLFVTQKIKAQFITADNKLFEKAKAQFNVLHIRAYQESKP